MRSRIKAFTLVELLVVISIIALLLAILMPALQKARKQGLTIVCLNNIKSLGQAWVLYADENGGKLIFAGTTMNQRTLAPRSNDNYVYQTNPWAVGLSAEGCKKGGLYKYVRNVEIYRCPADNRYKVHRDIVSPRYDEQWRSYSISDLMNGYYTTPTYSDGREGIRRVYSLSQIPRPSERLVFIEEGPKFPGHRDREYGIISSPGAWVMNPTAPAYIDALAIWHGSSSRGACGMGFADGHSENIKLDNLTTTIMEGQNGINVAIHPLNRPAALEGSETIFYISQIYSGNK